MGCKKTVEIIKELDWKGEIVRRDAQGNYDYEKIECIMQGVRDFIKFLKKRLR